MSANVLAIVAHPDDESLWCGDTLATCAALGHFVTVLCLTNGNVPQRRTEFHAACGALGVKPVILDYPDQRSMPMGCADSELYEVLADASPMLLLTHGPQGELGEHPHHVECFELVMRWSQRHAVPLICFAPSPRPPSVANFGLFLDQRRQIVGTSAECKRHALSLHLSQRKTISELLATPFTEAFEGSEEAFGIVLALGLETRRLGTA